MKGRHISYADIDQGIAKISKIIKKNKKMPGGGVSVYHQCASYMLFICLGLDDFHRCSNKIRSRNIFCTICAKHSFLYKVANFRTFCSYEQITKCLLCPKDAVYESACEKHSCGHCRLTPTRIIVNLVKICLQRKHPKTKMPRDIWRLLFMELQPNFVVSYHVKSRYCDLWHESRCPKSVRYFAHQHHPIRKNYRDDLIKVHLEVSEINV